MTCITHQETAVQAPVHPLLNLSHLQAQSDDPMEGPQLPADSTVQSPALRARQQSAEDRALHQGLSKASSLTRRIT